MDHQRTPKRRRHRAIPAAVATTMLAAMGLASQTPSAVAAPSANNAAAAVVTPVLNVGFAGSFNGTGAYQPTNGEVVAGALTKSSGTASTGSVVLGGGGDGLSFTPSASIGSNSHVTTSYAVEINAQRNAAAIVNYDTLLSIGGGIDYRAYNTAGDWHYDMFGIDNNSPAAQPASTPATTEVDHYGLVYTYASANQSLLDLYVNGCLAGTTLVNLSAAQLASNAVGFGREVHPSSAPRGFHGTITGVAAESYTGTFPGASAFQLAAGRVCSQPPVSPSNVIPVSANDNTATLEAKAAAVRPTAQQAAWQALKYTAFVHFNMPTFLNVEGGDGRAPAATFNPPAVDTDQWATVLKNAGFKEVILTVKHADGFFLFPSANTDYSVAQSGYTQDVVQKFVTSMHNAGLKVGFYFSPGNRHELNVVHSQVNPNYPRYGYSAAKGTQSCQIPAVAIPGKPTFTYNVDEYNCLYMRELYELFSNYGAIDEWWIDGNGTSARPGADSWDGFSAWASAGNADPTQQYANVDWYQMVNALQPNMLAFNGWGIRWVGNETGFARPGGEWSGVAINNQPTDAIPSINGGGSPGDRSTWPNAKNFIWLPTEVDVPISAQGNWFSHTGDTAKSTTQLWQIAAASVGRNANLLLDFGPDTTGVIPNYEVTAANALKAKIDRVWGTDQSGGCPLQVAPGGYGFTCHFATAKSIDWVGLAEDTVNYGQRVDSYTLQYLDPASGAWTSVTPISWDASGNQIADTNARIGAQRYLQLPNAVTTTDIRVLVTSSRQTPHLTSIGVGSTTFPGTVVSLRSHANNMIVTADNAGASPLIANRTAITTREEFDLIYNADGSVSLRSHANNMIVTADNAGASPLIANRTAINTWEEFDLIRNADGSVSLRSHANNMIVTAESTGASPLIANRTAINTWEEFDLING